MTISTRGDGGYLAEDAEDLLVAHLSVFVDVGALL